MRRVPAFFCLSSSICSGLFFARRTTVDEIPEHAHKLHFSSIALDAHAHTPQRLLTGTFELGKLDAEGHVDIPRMLEGDVSRTEEKFKKEGGDDNVCIGKAETRLQNELIAAGKLPHVSGVKIIEQIDHVGLGSDFDGADMPDGLGACSKLPNIREALLRKILGGNILRVMEQSEKISKEMQAAQWETKET